MTNIRVQAFCRGGVCQYRVTQVCTESSFFLYRESFFTYYSDRDIPLSVKLCRSCDSFIQTVL